MPSESPEQPTQPASSASLQSVQQSQPDDSLRTQLVRFIAVGVVCAVAILYLSTFAVQNILYKVVPMPLHSFELPKFVVDTISFVIAQGVATVTNFVMQRAFIFKQR